MTDGRGGPARARPAGRNAHQGRVAGEKGSPAGPQSGPYERKALRRAVPGRRPVDHWPLRGFGVGDCRAVRRDAQIAQDGKVESAAVWKVDG
jgi:hypothetical protein